MISVWMLVVFMALAALRVPICVAMGVGAFLGIALMGLPVDTMVRYMLDSVRAVPLLAIPFFILAASIMNQMGLTRRIFDFASSLVGFVSGGLAQVNILSSVIFAGISGSALADIAGLGTVQIRAMTDQGYRLEFSAAITIASSTIGPIIPPSIMFIIFAVNMNTSIGQLFVAGILPGFMIAIVLMATVWILAKTGLEACPPVRRSGPREIARSFWRGMPAILTPAIIVTGMVSGVATATEAAVLAVLYSIFLGALYREITFGKLRRAFESSIRTTALIMYLTGIGSVIAFVLTSEQAADLVAGSLLSLSDQRWLLLLLINVAILFLGCVLETLPALLISMPLFGPVAFDLGVAPLQFGVMLTFNLLIGIITPPIGIGLYAICAITGLRLEAVIKSTAVFLPTLFIALLLITYVAPLSTWLPGVLFAD
jgi:tripartite ATP-independent transporter DctM subunit